MDSLHQPQPAVNRFWNPPDPFDADDPDAETVACDGDELPY